MQDVSEACSDVEIRHLRLLKSTLGRNFSSIERVTNLSQVSNETRRTKDRF